MADQILGFAFALIMAMITAAAWYIRKIDKKYDERTKQNKEFIRQMEKNQQETNELIRNLTDDIYPKTDNPVHRSLIDKLNELCDQIQVVDKRVGRIEEKIDFNNGAKRNEKTNKEDDQRY